MAEAKTKAKPKSELAPPERDDLLDGGRLYGPFREYEIVTTDYGEYGLRRGLRLGFIAKERLNKQTLQMERHPFPVYFAADGVEMHGNGVGLDAMRARAGDHGDL